MTQTPEWHAAHELRLDAKAFRENTVYDSEGEPLRLLANADRMDAGAAAIEALEADNAALKAKNEALVEALAKANSPVWFYHPDHTEVCQWSPEEVIDDYYDPEPGEYVFEVECARPLPSIWCAVRVTADEDADERFTFTEHASEDEARQALAGAQ